MNTRTWTVFVSVLIVGIAIAIGVWFFVKISTDTTGTSAPSEEGRTFLSFFGEQFGFTTPDQPFATSTDQNTLPGGPSFREVLARETLLPLGDEMISGSTFMLTSTTTTITVGTTTEEVELTREFVRFVERETGRVNDLSLETGQVSRMTNTTIPRVQEALWGPNGSSIILRYLDDTNNNIETFVARLSTEWERTATDLIGTFFPQNIVSIAPSPFTDEVFYITTTANQGMGRIANLSNSEQRVIFVSPLREWTTQWKTENKITVTTKPSYLAVGIANNISRDGAISRIDSSLGLTVLPNPSNTRVLIGNANAQRFSASVLTLNGQVTYVLPFNTLPEKCVWKNDSELICAVPATPPTEVPDLWYQGSVSFDDTLWFIDVASETTIFLYDPQNTGARQSMDIIDLHISKDGSMISFINKKDLQGWIGDVDLSQTPEL